MPYEVEVIMWCPTCNVERARVSRKPANTGVFEHVTEPEDMTGVKACTTCGVTLEGKRNPNG